jgi:hypothetical protein
MGLTGHYLLVTNNIADQYIIKNTPKIYMGDEIPWKFLELKNTIIKNMQ